MPLLAKSPSATSPSSARSSEFDRFLPPLDEVHGAYRLRFANSERDKDAIYRLRFEVFGLELGEGLPDAYTTGRDTDPFDAVCHHLLVEDIATGEVVGTYRLQLAEMAERGLGFYSATEFDLSSLPAHVLAGSVELGRACVAILHRNRAVLFLLWRGLAAYLLWNRRTSFFGCSSLTSQDCGAGARLFAELEREGVVSRDLSVFPLRGFECGAPTPGKRVPLPRLFSIYVRHGAVVLGPPAIDRQFGTIDFLTFLDMQRLPKKMFRLFTEGPPGGAS